MNYSVEKLVKQIEDGKEVSYTFFWGHKVDEHGLTESCFSQWWESTFVVDGIKFRSAEHWMMYQKALIFNDLVHAQKILDSNTPAQAKKFGRKVIGFNDKIWQKVRFNIVVQGNIHKFGQDENLKKFLLETGDSIIVEASPYDAIWGIGFIIYDENASIPKNWKGLNLLGFALMEARDNLRSK